MKTPDSPARQAIEAAQLARLRTLIGELGANDFYAPRLAAAGIDAALPDLAAFRRLPLTTKAEIAADQLAQPPWGTNLSYPRAAYSRYHQTSGTTGSPIRWLDTNDAWSAMLDCWELVYDAAGVTAADRIYFAFSFGPFLGFWTAFEAGTRRGCLCLPGGGLSSASRLAAMQANQATVLCCTPTYAIHLAEVAAQTGVDLSAGVVRRIIVAGEPGGNVPATRARLEALWPGATVVDHHGMTETGPVTADDPEMPGHLRLFESHYIAEVIEPTTGAPVAAGETGELVLTNLFRPGSPLLRYRTGDRVVPVFAADDGLRLRGGILGRADDMVLVRGVNIYPAAVEDVIRQEPDVLEYRVHVTTVGAMTELRVEIEPRPDHPAAAALAASVAERLRTAFSLRIPVAAVAPASLPRFELKARRWQSH